ncbi:MAG TPA: OmpW family outer membrane protein [Arenimonas sp.]|nr:OmpW family outer membrane protein [Arenimonas sp.]HPO23972.1 OmpW family outer membrane protein [Arenimonas sp.]
MPRISTLGLAFGLVLLASNAHAENVTATLGFHNVNPKSDNGTLAGAEASVDDDWAVTGSVAYHFADNWSVELWSGLEKYEHDVSLAGLGTVGSVKHRPTTLGVNYHFMKESKFRPFLGLGYGWVNVSGEKSTGALAGTVLRADNSSGLTANLGADYYFNDNFFVRGDVRYLNFDSDVTVDGAAVGTANVDPLIYGISAGVAF